MKLYLPFGPWLKDTQAATPGLRLLHPENVNTAAMSPYTFATLKFFVSQFGSLATYPPSADMGITAILSAHSIITYLFKSFSITWAVC